LDTDVRDDDDDDFIYDIDDVAYDIGSDDEVDPTYDEFAEVGPARIDMALSVAPSYHGGDVGGDPPERPNSSGQRGSTTLQALKTAYKKNDNKMLKVQFEYKDQKTFRPVGGYSSNLVSLIGNLVKNLSLDCDKWDQIPETARVLILPELKEAKQHMQPEDDWKKGQATWEKQVDKWADPKRVENQQRMQRIEPKREQRLIKFVKKARYHHPLEG
ncbi:hypothetical protein Tco_1546818, partial [Tanacetum coccineum]